MTIKPPATDHEHHGPVLDEVKGYKVIDCQRCGFKHVLPLPTAEELTALYRDEFYDNEKPEYLDTAAKDREWWDLVFRQRFDVLARLLPGDRRRVVDVGSGPGLFLECGRKLGWRVMGLEPSRLAVERCRDRGLEVVQGFLDQDTAERLGRFDAVHLSEVLEHVADPAGLLGLVYELVEPGGAVCVAAPNDYNPFQQVLADDLGFRPWWVAPPHHLNYFDFNSLGRLLAQAGFVSLERTATFPMELFLLMGQNYVGDDEAGRRLHHQRVNLEMNLDKAGRLDLLADFYAGLAERGLGRECIVYGRKE